MNLSINQTKPNFFLKKKYLLCPVLGRISLVGLFRLGAIVSFFFGDVPLAVCLILFGKEELALAKYLNKINFVQFILWERYVIFSLFRASSSPSPPGRRRPEGPPGIITRCLISSFLHGFPSKTDSTDTKYVRMLVSYGKPMNRRYVLRTRLLSLEHRKSIPLKTAIKKIKPFFCSI